MATVIVQGDARQLPLADRAVNLTMGSCPYLKARKYGRGDIAMGLGDWVGFMLAATKEAVRVTDGLVLWVCAGQYENGRYQPGPEALAAAAYDAGGIDLYRPCVWTKNGLPGGPAQWPRNCWEYVLAFKRPGALPWEDLLAMGTPPKYPAGGRMRNRGKNDKRCNRPYPVPTLAKPSDVIHVAVGGGHMGHELAHENEAPYPEKLAEFFVRCYCPPGGTVLDPFCGSGTTIAVARRQGRNGIGVDIRGCQVALATRRVADPCYDPPGPPAAMPPLPLVRGSFTLPPAPPPALPPAPAAAPAPAALQPALAAEEGQAA